MNFEEQFIKQIRALSISSAVSPKYLLAVSGGVDSMVLLRLFQNIRQNEELVFAVAHVNHKLRDESEEEHQYLEKYCKESQIPFYSRVWKQNIQEETGVEKRARDFRYSFFRQLMEKENFPYLVTGHHADDQAETVVMKIIQGSLLENLQGIRRQRDFFGRQLIRPLLPFSKKKLYQFAEENQIFFFEDQTNKEEKYFRNRVRHQILPLMKQENPNFLQGIHNLSTQIQYTHEILNDLFREKGTLLFKPLSKELWEITVKSLKKEAHAAQYMLLVQFFQKSLVEMHSVKINQKQVEQVLHMLNSNQPNQKIMLAHSWVVEKSYDVAYLKKEVQEIDSDCKRSVLLERYHLEKNQEIYLSEDEWIGIFDSEVLPKVLFEDYKAFSYELPEKISFPLTIRHKQDGDKIRLKTEGYTKKVSRIFIDEKISLEKRKKTWLVEDQMLGILWVIPMKKSYLSIKKETDKIQYRLIYCRKM